ncbi:MAG TPA: hypothetical protein VHN78_13145, partial [Chloroflexota bacterium]|nr:hypothetical protein [Chloroflexota bacterium]
VGAAPTAGAAVTDTGLPRVSATSGPAGLPGGHAETRRALPRPAQGQRRWARLRHPAIKKPAKKATKKATTATKAA